MSSQDRVDRLQKAIADASRRLDWQSKEQEQPPLNPVPGGLYVFDTKIDAAIEWLVVRPHPDDPTLVLLVPGDDFPLIGSSDVPLKPEFVDRPLTVRCGEAGWIAARRCLRHLYVGTVPEEAVSIVRRKLAALARGDVSDDPETRCVDEDPEYDEWLGLVALAREAIQRRPEPISVEGKILPFESFATQRPECLADEPQLALAAKSAGSLLADLSESLASDVPRYSELPLASGGNLIFIADARGVRVSWTSPTGVSPPALRVFDGTGLRALSWRSLQSTLQKAHGDFPWIDGQVVLEVGTEPPQTLTIRL